MVPDDQKSDKSTNSVGTVSIALVFVVLSGVIGAVAEPSQSAAILSSVSGIAIMLVALMREIEKTHRVVNSRMDELLRVSKIAAGNAAVTKERARVKQEEPADDT